MSVGVMSVGALDGLRVLDLSRVLAGPWAAQALGDLGADVTKVEQPGRGDETRRWGPPFLDGPDGPNDAAYYLATNRNKRCIAVDFAQPEGADLVRRLAAQSDVVIENFRTGGLVRYGLDYSTLAARDPRLIYCSITGFGQTGPYATHPGYDFLIQGMSGLMSITGTAEGGPTKVGVAVSDVFTGLYAVNAILAALHHRERTGQGQHIDCALLDSQVGVLVNQAMNLLVSGKEPGRLGNAHPNVVPYREFATADGHVLVACGADSHFRALCGVLGLPDVAADPAYASNARRLMNRATLETALGDAIGIWSRDALLAAMTAAGVPGGPINTIGQALADPQVRARGMVQTMHRGDGTEVKVIAYPSKLSATPATYRIAPQRQGEDTDAVLAERLGLDATELARLRAAKVTGGVPDRDGVA